MPSRLAESEWRTRPCGHARHVGTCAGCQRAQLARWRGQLMQVSDAHAYQAQARAALPVSATIPTGPRSS
jgi:hypothetical protein